MVPRMPTTAPDLVDCVDMDPANDALDECECECDCDCDHDMRHAADREGLLLLLLLLDDDMGCLCC